MDNNFNYFQGIRFDHWEIRTLVDYVINHNSGYSIVITPNVDHVIRISRNKDLLPLYQAADICINDSRILSNLTRLFGINLGHVIPGSDLTAEIMERIAGSNRHITIIGTGKSTVDVIKEKYCLSNITHYNPPMGFINIPEEVDKCVNVILENSNSIIFLAVGSPRQEILAQKAKESGASGVALCIGASLLFLSNEEKRAPQLIRKLSLEWMFRLIQSPRRLAKRYLIDGPLIFPLLVKEIFERKKHDK